MDFDVLKELVDSNQFSKLRQTLSEYNEVDIAEFMQELNDDELLKVFRILPKDICAEVFTYMSNEQQQHVVMSFSDKEVRYIVDQLFLDDTVDFLEEVPAGVVKKVLKNVDNETRKLINTFLQYPDDSAGSIMTVEFVELHADYTVEQAIDVIRKTGVDKETVYTCYVITPERWLIGFVALRTLLLSKDGVLVSDIMEDRIITANTLDDKKHVADMIKKYDFLSIPVVDTEGRLVGIVTVDDAIDVIEEENTEDFEIMAAMSPSEKPYLKTSVLSLSKNRIVWLLLLMISATFTGTIIGHFEELLSSAIILATFIPMISNTGGNAGSQSATLIIRGLALGEIKYNDFFRVIRKEFGVSVICGGILSCVNFLRLLLIKVDMPIALVVSASLWVTVITAKFIGGILPVGAKIMKFDPAIMASPMITTIVDAVALIIYFSLATSILGL